MQRSSKGALESTGFHRSLKSLSPLPRLQGLSKRTDQGLNLLHIAAHCKADRADQNTFIGDRKRAHRSNHSAFALRSSRSKPGNARILPLLYETELLWATHSVRAICTLHVRGATDMYPGDSVLTVLTVLTVTERSDDHKSQT